MLLLTACDGRSRSSGDPLSVSDSAGIRLVQHASLQAWEADATLSEVIRVGVVDGPPEVQFSRIAGGRLLPDGGLVVADSEAREVRQFGPGGDFVGSQGREGEGPGEYKFITGMGNCAPEGFTVFDIGWTMSIFGGSGDFIEERLTRLEGGATPYNLACDTSGLLAVINWDVVNGPRVGFHVAMGRLRLLNPDGTERADLGERIGSERFGRPSGSGPHPIGRAIKFAFLDSDLVVADGSFFGYERWDAEGRLKEIVRVDVPRPDGDSLMSVYLESALARADDDETRARTRSRIASMEGPDRASFLSDLIVSTEHILIGEVNVEQTGRWFAFEQDGTPVGFLPLPGGAELLDIRGDWLLVEERDDMGVPAVVVYAISWP